MNLTKTNWPAGWNPSADPVNGDPNSLQRMDNLQWDEQGVLTLVRGLQQINTAPFSSYVNNIYSKIINGHEVLWVGLGFNGALVQRSILGNFNDAVTVVNGSDQVAFGDALGNVLICAGSQRIKDDGISVTNNLGLATPGTPTVQVNSQAVLNVNGTFTVPIGTLNTSNSTGCYFFVDPTQLLGQTQCVPSTTPFDTTAIGAGPSDDNVNDTIQFQITPDNAAVVTAIRMDFILNFNNAGQPTDYYSYIWDGALLLPGLGQTSTLSAQRGQFNPANPGGTTRRLNSGQRSGSTQGFDWTHVVAINVTVQMTSQTNCSVNFIQILGGIQGQLNGTYTYIQVNLNNNGAYVARSPASNATTAVSLINGFTTLTPSTTEAQVNQIQFYRINTQAPAVSSTPVMDQYYLVATTTPGVPVQDTTADLTAIQENIFLNPFLKTLLFSDVNSGISDTILSIVGPYNELILYMTFNAIYLSDSLDPDAIDSRYTIKISGDATEKNIWMRKITNNVIILATTKDLYELTGTFRPLPDGSIDINIIPIGENYRPLSESSDAVCGIAGALFYTAADGIRTTAGSNTQLISPQLKLLFEGETRGGIAPVVITQYVRYSIAIGKTRLYVTLPLQDGSSILALYDLITQQWRMQYIDPVTVYVTQTDRVLLGFATSVNGMLSGQLFELDKGNGVTDVNGNILVGTPITFLTVYDANGQPRNRKDTFTLKLICDTGGNDCQVQIAKDGKNFQNIAPDGSLTGYLNCNGLTTNYFRLDGVTLGFRYAIKITDRAYLLKFKLYELTIEYDPRPEQVDYLRIPPNNLGTISRKRIVNYAFVIDTLGNPITFTPYIDNSNTGVLPATSIVNTPTKQTYIHYFTQEQIGTDVNGILSGGVFEFYSINLEEIISEKMPVPCEFLVIPNNNYGSPNRKRHSSYKFQINTRGANVVFTPKLDGTFGTPQTYNTSEKRIVEYYFTVDTIAREVGGTLSSNNSGIPFEFYGVIVPQTVENLPDRLEYYRIPNNNFGVAAPKRIRTIPLVIDTYGQNVLFQPIVDGLPDATGTIFNTNGKITVFHYYTFDSFGTDYGGQLTSQTSTPFEFYGFDKMEDVEILPVAKKFDQIGPLRFDRIGKIFLIRVRVIPLNGLNSIPWFLVNDTDVQIPGYGSQSISGALIVNPGLDDVYEIQLPKSINTTNCRLVLGPTTQPFCRYDAQFKVSLSGMESDSQWIPVGSRSIMGLPDLVR